LKQRLAAASGDPQSGLRLAVIDWEQFRIQRFVETRRNSCLGDDFEIARLQPRQHVG
jgi:hypothetical protein